ncbi:MAG: glycosyltransferase family 4 protein [Caldilineales bacterium]|nr:glycosyltransferase family 4 protein [Caldilineales bacterium]MCW5859465.1 glycosyltransferase family 4 protein [Caldilineales bacterium]
MAPSETTNAPLRIVHINLTDSQGGAAIAARRLHLALRRAGHDSRMLVWRKYTDDPFVEIFEKGAFRRGLSQVVGRKLDEFGLQYLFHPASMRLPEHPWLREADIVNLHLGHGGYLSTRALPRLSRRAPLVWTMHDLWAVSGHCAFAAADDCNRWLTGCGNCPRLDDSPAVRTDLTATMWRLKARTYARSRLVTVCPSDWLAGKMRQSPLLNRFPIHTIANGLDLDLFRPVARPVAREALGLPRDRKIIMFGAASLADPRKGARYLRQALASLPEHVQRNSTLLLVGGKAGEITDALHDIPVIEMGKVDNETLMALCYAAADVFVMASLAENLPNSLVESLACGTPCVCFDVGGCPEIIEHLQTGYLARPQAADDLAHGIDLVLSDDALRHRMGAQAPERVRQSFEASRVAGQYLDLYRQTRLSPRRSASSSPLAIANA